jgi:4-hydroxy-3-polyprenylbenzoate decarboxylase
MLRSGHVRFPNGRALLKCGRSVTVVATDSSFYSGAPPVVQYAATANLPWGSDEIEVAGGVLGKPVKLVKAKSIDLLVPADAEIVIEGEIHPGETDLEGPFGEFAGYMGPVAQKPVARITAITHRKDPIYCAMTSQMPPSESTIVQSLTNAGVVQKMLRHDLGEYTVHDVYIDQRSAGLWRMRSAQ